MKKKRINMKLGHLLKSTTPLTTSAFCDDDEMLV